MHDVIYLIPDDEHGFLWCTDPAPGIGMEKSEAVKYIRADLVGAQEHGVQGDGLSLCPLCQSRLLDGKHCIKCATGILPAP